MYIKHRVFFAFALLLGVVALASYLQWNRLSTHPGSMLAAAIGLHMANLGGTSLFYRWEPESAYNSLIPWFSRWGSAMVCSLLAVQALVWRMDFVHSNPINFAAAVAMSLAIVFALASALVVGRNCIGPRPLRIQ